MILWPSTLQQLLNSASWSFNYGETNVRSSMDTGAPKVRRRFTHRIDSMSCSIEIDKNTYSVFESYYTNTLSQGTKQFSFTHPLTGTVNTQWRFAGSPKISYIGGEYFRIDMSWELLP